MRIFKENKLLNDFYYEEEYVSPIFRPDQNWNDLMKMIGQIYGIAKEDNEVFESNEIQSLQDCLITHDIDYVYSNVVEFVKFYNELKKKNDKAVKNSN